MLAIGIDGEMWVKPQAWYVEGWDEVILVAWLNVIYWSNLG